MSEATTSGPRTVFVTGAGFTRAFVPNAPLLKDNYGITELAKKFAGFEYVKPILTEALHASGGQGEYVDLERLMTRASGMPYDNEDARRELALLDVYLRRALVARIEKAKAKDVKQDSLAKFARHVVKSAGTVVTFNYDDVLDQAMWEVEKAHENIIPQGRYWHPDGGYGFFCRPAMTSVVEQGVYMDKLESA